jgi:uncharacterized protein YegL
MKSYVAIVVDRSGSMADPVYDKVGGITAYGSYKRLSEIATQGIKSFIAEQKAMKINGKTGFSLVQFDGNGTEVVEQVGDIRTSTVNYNLVPRGNTPLWDAIGFTVEHIDEKISKLRKRDKPKGVMVVVVTDGAENASTKWKQSTIAELIEAKKKENWDFTFLCNNPMVAKEASDAGLQNVALYANNKVDQVYSSVSSKVARTRNAIEQTGTFSSTDCEFTQNEIRSMS